MPKIKFNYNIKGFIELDLSEDQIKEGVLDEKNFKQHKENFKDLLDYNLHSTLITVPRNEGFNADYKITKSKIEIE